MMPIGNWDAQPARPLRPIAKPGASPMALWSLRGLSPLAIVAMVMTIVIAGLLGGVLAAAGATGLGMTILMAPVAVIAVAALAGRKDVFTGPSWSLNGVRVRGEALDMVEDIQQRFLYAERLVHQVPTGIDWAEVRTDVETILWESVEHATQVSALDGEIHDMRYAQPGTPQAALLRQLKERRAEHWQVLLDNQREAELLAREAGNAAAAAKVALARTGTLQALQVVVPSTRTLAARGSLAEARARLSMLADVWSELDETGALEAERLGLNEPGALEAERLGLNEPEPQPPEQRRLGD